MTEAQLQRFVLELAAKLRFLPYHTHDSRKSHTGFPDLVLLRPPRLIFAELKGDSDYGKKGPTEDQRRWINALKLVPGVEVYVWYPRDINDIVTILNSRGSPSWP